MDLAGSDSNNASCPMWPWLESNTIDTFARHFPTVFVLCLLALVADPAKMSRQSLHPVCHELTLDSPVTRLEGMWCRSSTC